jgi:hypothetical protein
MVLSLSVARAAGATAFGLGAVVADVTAAFGFGVVVVVDVAAGLGLAVVVVDVAAGFGLTVLVVDVVAVGFGLVGVPWPISEPVKHRNKNPRICSGYHSGHSKKPGGERRHNQCRRQEFSFVFN